MAFLKDIFHPLMHDIFETATSEAILDNLFAEITDDGGDVLKDGGGAILILSTKEASK